MAAIRIAPVTHHPHAPAAASSCRPRRLQPFLSLVRDLSLNDLQSCRALPAPTSTKLKRADSEDVLLAELMPQPRSQLDDLQVFNDNSRSRRTLRIVSPRSRSPRAAPVSSCSRPPRAGTGRLARVFQSGASAVLLHTIAALSAASPASCGRCAALRRQYGPSRLFQIEAHTRHSDI